MGLTGEEITVRFRVIAGRDEYGDDVFEYPDKQGKRTITWGSLLESGTWDDLLKGDIDISEAVPDGSMTIQNVLIAPIEGVEPEADSNNGSNSISWGYDLYMPRDFVYDLRGALIDVRGETFEVRSRPRLWQESNLPDGCEWNMVVRAVAFDG